MVEFTSVIFLKNIKHKTKFSFDRAETWTFNHFRLLFIHFSSNICWAHIGSVLRVSDWKMRFWVKVTKGLMCSLTPGSSSDLLHYKWTVRAEIPFSCFQKSWVEDQSKLQIVHEKCKVRLPDILTRPHVRKEESRSLSFPSPVCSSS